MKLFTKLNALFRKPKIVEDNAVTEVPEIKSDIKIGELIEDEVWNENFNAKYDELNGYALTVKKDAKDKTDLLNKIYDTKVMFLNKYRTEDTLYFFIGIDSGISVRVTGNTRLSIRYTSFTMK
jgi:hypothetical protein